MRCWHKDPISYLPKSQLLAQWRELNSIFKNQPKHILINYVHEYSKNHLYAYSLLVIKEMKKRGYKIKNFYNLCSYFEKPFLIEDFKSLENVYSEIFKYDHDEIYLAQCYFNLQEKYLCGQKDFRCYEWKAIRDTFGRRVLAEVQRDLGDLE